MLSTARLLGQTGGAALVALLFSTAVGGVAGPAAIGSVLLLSAAFAAAGCAASLSRGTRRTRDAVASETAAGATAGVPARGDTLGSVGR